MSLMANPMDGLLSLQNAINAGAPVNLCELDANYKTRYDEADFGKRYIFAKIINGEVQALAIFGLEDPIHGVECWSVGYAVSEKHRGRGLAIEAFNKGVGELKKEFSRTKMERFYVEAVIDRTNIPSVKLAEKLFSTSGVAIIDGETGTPALHFKKLVTLR